jgi:hypothetical protein
MMTKVDRILKWGGGEWQTVILACGHRSRFRRADVKKLQLFPGMVVNCQECEADAEAPKK